MKRLILIMLSVYTVTTQTAAIGDRWEKIPFDQLGWIAEKAQELGHQGHLSTADPKILTNVVFDTHNVNEVKALVMLGVPIQNALKKRRDLDDAYEGPQELSPLEVCAFYAINNGIQVSLEIFKYLVKEVGMPISDQTKQFMTQLNGPGKGRAMSFITDLQ